MNKADYVQQLQQLGENPPRSWTIAELRSRITELREERGLGPVSSRNHTPLRTMMIEMNKASKRKGDLINYVEQNLGRPCHEQHDHQPDSTCGSQEDLHVHQPQQFRPCGLWRTLCNDLRATSPLSGELCCLGQEDCQGRRLRLQAVPTGKLAGEQGSIPSSTSKGEANCHVWSGDGREAKDLWSSGAGAEGLPREAHGSQESHRQLHSSSGELSRIQRCLELSRDLDGHDQGLEGRDQGAEGDPGRSSPPQEEREGGRQHGFLQHGVPVGDHFEPPSFEANKVEKYEESGRLSLQGQWCAVPEQKSRQLGQQAESLLSNSFDALVSDGRLKLLEVACSPTSVLSEATHKITKDESSARRCSLFNGYDLGTNDGIHKVIQDIDQFHPEHVWLSPVCGPFSAMQNVNQRTDLQKQNLSEKRREALMQYVGWFDLQLLCSKGYPCHLGMVSELPGLASPHASAVD